MSTSFLGCLCLFLLILSCSSSSSKHSLNATISLSVPPYCIDGEVEKIFKRRLQCVLSAPPAPSDALEKWGQTTITQEMRFLRRISPSEYQRSHELLAYHWFVEADNPYRRASCSDAELEYIPFLPMHWMVVQDPAPPCGYASLIEDIQAYVAYADKRDKALAGGVNKKQQPMPFLVASTFNMRTEMGTGMPTQVRRGPVYDIVTKFVTSMHLAHYERWPQCPDLLRKGWKHVVELPYIPLKKLAGPFAEGVNALLVNNEAVRHSFIDHKRSRTFLFSGRMLLFGPERVCSVRNAMATLATSRKDFFAVNITEDQSWSGGTAENLVAAYADSSFCIVAKADSYSTSSFYTAIQGGCVPIVISDWFAFAFPWAVPYEKFILRISENDFLSDPSGALDAILAKFGTEEKLREMRGFLWQWRSFLSFEGLDSGAPTTQQLRNQMKEQFAFFSDETTPPPVDSKKMTVLPFELMLIELRFFQTQEVSSHFGLMCETPFFCSHSNGVQVPPLKLAASLKEKRSHLCKHTHRLVGMYKMVYNQKCVRILWPLRPGYLKPNDASALSQQDKLFIERFHNITARPKDWVPLVYPPPPALNNITYVNLNTAKYLLAPQK